MAADSERSSGFPGGRAAWWTVLALLVAFVGLRYRAAWFSYALDGYSDEPAVVDPALAAARGDLRPAEFLYPGWSAYSIGATYKALDVLGYGGAEGFLPEKAGPDHLVVARLFVFGVSLATLIATALIGRRVAGAWGGLAAAALLACSPMFTAMSFLVTVNPPASFWTAMATLFALRVYQEGGKRSDYVLSAACAGLAIGCKYNAYPAALAVVLAHFFAPASGRRLSNLVLAGVVVPVVFVATTPYAVLEPARFLEYVRFLGDVYEKEWPLHYDESGTSWLEYVARMVKFGWPWEMSASALLGTALLLKSDWRRAAIVAVAPLLNFVFLGFYAVFFLRHLLPALPGLAVASGVLVQACADRVAARREPASGGRTVLASVAACVLVAGLGWRAFEQSAERVSRTELVDSRQAALEWILANVPKGSRIVREDRTPVIEEHSADYEVTFIRCIAEPDRTREAETHDYAVLSGMFDRFVRDPKFAAAREVYEQFYARHELVRDFKGNGVEYSGRDVRIYRIDKDASNVRK